MGATISTLKDAALSTVRNHSIPIACTSLVVSTSWFFYAMSKQTQTLVSVDLTPAKTGCLFLGGSVVVLIYSALNHFSVKGFADPKPELNPLFDFVSIAIPSSVLVVGLSALFEAPLISISSDLVGRLVSQGAFGLANSLYYKFYDYSKTDCLSYTYREDKYGISVSYLISQLLVHHMNLRQQFLLNSDNNPHRLFSILTGSQEILILRLLKTLCVHLIFQHPTSGRNDGSDQAHSAVHMGWVFASAAVEILFKLLSSLMKSAARSPCQLFMTLIRDPGTAFVFIWFFSFWLAQLHCDKSSDPKTILRLPIHNISWLCELGLLTTTIN